MKRLNILITLFLITIITGCAAFFQPRVPMDFDSSNAYLEDLLIKKEKGGKLGVPEQFSASRNADPSIISLTWTAVPDAVAYRIEYAVVSPNEEGKYPESVSEELFNVIEDYWYGLTYKHKITESTLDDFENRYEKRYFYRVSAINIRDGYDDGDPTAPTIYGTLFAPPKNVKASAGEAENYISITWDFTEGATKYKILRSESENGSGAGYVTTVLGNNNSYKDIISDNNKGKDFYYIVYAVNRDDKESKPSSLAMGYSLVPGAPGKPQNVKMLEGRGNHPNKIKLGWDEVASAEGTVKYNVFRYNSKDTALIRVGKEIGETNFTDTKNILPGIYYIYVVQAVVTDSITGKLLKSALSAPVEGFILSPPENIKAKKVEGGVQLSWDKAIGSPEEQEKYSYKIFTSNELNGEYTEQLTLTDTKANVGNFQFFKIKTVNDKNVESIDSDIASPTPDAAVNVEVSLADYSFISEQSLTANDFGVYPVKIKWAKPSGDEPYGYHVYRSLKEDSGYRKISENVILGQNTFYIDADEVLQPGKVYYYKVLAINSLEQGDNFSSYKYGWGALTHEQYLKEFNETIVSSQKKLTLMHKPGNTEKLGSETKNGTISGNVYYNASIAGLGAYITMKYNDYADFYIDPNKKEMGAKFNLSGNSDTSANMSSNGNMNGVINCNGMYPGTINYNKIEIKSGAAGGGFYGVTPKGFTSKDVPYNVLEAN